MVERIHVNWAYSENAEQKAAENQFYFQMLREQFHIAYSKSDLCEYTEIALFPISTQPSTKTYQIVKNTPKLRDEELALIADRGNLCFGYRRDGDRLIIYTD